MGDWTATDWTTRTKTCERGKVTGVRKRQQARKHAAAAATWCPSGKPDTVGGGGRRRW